MIIHLYTLLLLNIISWCYTNYLIHKKHLQINILILLKLIEIGKTPPVVLFWLHPVFITVYNVQIQLNWEKLSSSCEGFYRRAMEKGDGKEMKSIINVMQKETT